MREHDGFESGSYKYLSGAGEEEYVDVVCVKGKWYQCTKTYDNATSSPSLTDGHWTKMSQYKSIATHLLLAENATINMLGSNQINLYIRQVAQCLARLGLLVMIMITLCGLAHRMGLMLHSALKGVVLLR